MIHRVEELIASAIDERKDCLGDRPVTARLVLDNERIAIWYLLDLHLTIADCSLEAREITRTLRWRWWRRSWAWPRTRTIRLTVQVVIEPAHLPVRDMDERAQVHALLERVEVAVRERHVEAARREGGRDEEVIIVTGWDNRGRILREECLVRIAAVSLEGRRRHRPGAISLIFNPKTRAIRSTPDVHLMTMFQGLLETLKRTFDVRIDSLGERRSDSNRRKERQSGKRRHKSRNTHTN
jgi:hypothetical protein